MRILADENVPRTIVAWLRGEGHDVLYAAESRAQKPDADLLAEAEAEGYVVPTEDKDFGELIDRDRRNSHGLILLRMEDQPVAQRLVRLRAVWAVIASHLPDNFLVVTPARRRVRPLTSP